MEKLENCNTLLSELYNHVIRNEAIIIKISTNDISNCL